MKRITPLITIPRLEEAVEFWSETMGMELLATVPHEDAMGFAMLQDGPLQIMYQSTASVAGDLGGSDTEGLAAEFTRSTPALFIEVESIDALLPRLEGLEVVVPRRTTFYGMDEIFVRPPCGTVVGFAARVTD